MLFHIFLKNCDFFSSLTSNLTNRVKLIDTSTYSSATLLTICNNTGDKIKAFLDDNDLSWSQEKYEFYFDIVVSGTTMKRFNFSIATPTKFSFTSWRTSSGFPNYLDHFNLRIDGTSPSYTFYYTFTASGVTAASSNDSTLVGTVNLYVKTLA